MLSQLSYNPIYIATRMGFEPMTSAVTGRRSNQLSHQAGYLLIKWTLGDSFVSVS
jgi:hypothetical protein